MFDPFKQRGTIDSNSPDFFYRNYYEPYLYSGLQGLAMGISHRLMEFEITKSANSHCLEIGGLAMPHLLWMDRSSILSYDIYDRIHLEDKALKELKKLCHNVQYYRTMPELGASPFHGKFSRIIASHVLEHVVDPEKAILDWICMLRTDGVLSISLPCDPGWTWRLAQLFSCRKYMRLTKKHFRDYELICAREHVSSTQRLLKIINFYFVRKKIIWFPAILPVVDFNLFCVITLRKADMRPVAGTR
jgi:phosphatidylethanolamine/phosphatidyl-N-methylethanolamine N-methyltransferase